MFAIQSGVYAITNTVNGQQYIGSTQNFAMRWEAHRYRLGRGRHHSRHLQGAWNTYGQAAFTFEIVELVPGIDALFEREQFYLDRRYALKGSHEYNMRPTAQGSRGIPLTQQHRRNISTALKGRKQRPEWVERRSEGMRNAWEKLRGTPQEAAWRKSLSEKQRGIKPSQKNLDALRAAAKARKGKPWTAKQRENGAASIAQLLDPANRAKGAETFKRRPRTPEQEARWRESGRRLGEYTKLGLNRRPDPSVPDGHKRCLTCKEVKPLASFPKRRGERSHLYESHCLPCAKMRLKAWRAAHPRK